MCNRIENFCGSPNHSFAQHQERSVFIVAIALVFITLSVYGDQGKIPIGPVGAKVMSSFGCILLMSVVVNYLGIDPKKTGSFF